MEHHSSLLSLAIVVALAFLIPILLQRVRLGNFPVVVAEILAGIIVGKSGLNIVQSEMWLEVLSSLGFIFLMFLSGLEIDFSLFRQRTKPSKEPNAFRAASFVFLLIFGLSYLLSLTFVQFGLVSNSFFMTLIISTVSLGVVVPVLKDGNVSKTSIGQTILLTAVIADLVTMVLLAVFVGLHSTSGQSMWLLLLLFAAGVILYIAARWFRKLHFIEHLRKGSIQIDTRAVFALILILVGLSERVGAESILGAFLAGVLVSLLSPNPEITEKLESIGYGLFIPIFFVMVGINLELWSIVQNPSSMLIIPLLLVAFFLSKLVPSLILRKWYSWNIVVSSSILLTSTLSLVIAAAQIGEKLGIIEGSLSAAFVLSAVITCIAGPILFKKVFPKIEVNRKKVAIVGADRVTLPLSLDLLHEEYDVTLYSTMYFKHMLKESEEEASLPLLPVKDFSISSLKQAGVFTAEHLVFATDEDHQNLELALYAKSLGLEHIITKIEDPALQSRATYEHIHVFSALNSTRFLLKALIDNPSLLRLIENSHDTIREIRLTKYKYDGIAIRNLPSLEDVLILQIMRGTNSIVPRGDTRLYYKDVLLVTGAKEDLDVLQQLLK